MKSIRIISSLILSLSSIIVMVTLSACNNTSEIDWPDNQLLNPDAEQDLDHWTSYDEGVLIDNEQGDSLCFSIRNGATLFQDVQINREQGQYALLIGCMAADYVHQDGSITDLPSLYGYMKNENNHIDEYLQGQNMGGVGIVQDQWTTAWGIYAIPTTTTSIRFFMSQSLMFDESYTGAQAFFDDLGLYQFESEELALKYVDRYQRGCGTASLVDIVPGETLTILPDGSTTTTNRLGTKRIQISINLGENRAVTNPPIVMYWSDSLDVDGFESATRVENSENQYYFDLPSSENLEICEWMKYRWIVGYENTLLSKSGLKFDDERYVMPSTYYVGCCTVKQAMCQAPGP
ncbi:MAG: hypothetical protein JEZ00_13160 [Anaerolineaceae bacterium]|nr:hypothetical protein [Anaerolineaceae bacterium]